MSWEADGSNVYWDLSDPRVENNAILIAEVLVEYDYDLKAIAAVLGNAMSEGTMNPWLWEGGVPTYDYFMQHQAEFNSRGYGLYQYTNPNKYINVNSQSLPGYDPHFYDVTGSPEDGEAQTHWLALNLTNEWNTNHYGDYYQGFLDDNQKDINDFYWITVPDFIAGNAQGSTEDEQIENLTGAFELCFERPRTDRAIGTYNLRVSRALYFYDMIQGVGGRSKFNWMYYLKPWWKGRIL